MVSRSKQIKTRGFTLIEMIIALTITAVLLTAIAFALNASSINYQENENIFKAVNMARQALIRITSQVRTGLIDPNNISDESVCELLCADNSAVRYHYDSVGKKLYLYDYNTATDYLLCDDVSAMSFKKDNNTPTGDVKCVRISITVDDGKLHQTLAGAAVVRRVLTR